MEPVRHLHSPRAGVYCWKGYEEEIQSDLSATAIVHRGQLVFIDPIPLAEEAMSQLVAAAAPRCILLSNVNHQRASLEFKELLQIPIFAPESCRTILEADEYFQPEQAPLAGIEVVALPGFAPGETAFLFDQTVLVLGDAMQNHSPEGLRMLREQYCEDPHLAMASLGRIAQLADFEVVCFGHGMPIEEDGKGRLLEAFQETGVVPQ